MVIDRCIKTIEYCVERGFETMLVTIGDSIIKNRPSRYSLGDERYEQIMDIARKCYELSGNEHVAKTL